MAIEIIETSPKTITPEKVLTPQEGFSQTVTELCDMELDLLTLRADWDGLSQDERQKKRSEIEKYSNNPENAEKFGKLITKLESLAPSVGYDPIETWKLVLGHSHLVGEKAGNNKLGQEARIVKRRAEELLAPFHEGIENRMLFNLRRDLTRLSFEVENPSAVSTLERVIFLENDISAIEQAAICLGLANTDFYRQLAEKIAAIREGSTKANESTDLGRLEQVYRRIAEERASEENQ